VPGLSRFGRTNSQRPISVLGPVARNRAIPVALAARDDHWQFVYAEKLRRDARVVCSLHDLGAVNSLGKVLAITRDTFD